MKLAMQVDRNGGISCRKDGYLFALSKRVKEPVPTDGTEAEYMIVDLLGKHPMGLIVMPATGCVIVEHTGFECSGSMCTTTAWTVGRGKSGPDDLGWLTPGRVQDLVHVANNVNVRVDRSDARPKKPGRVYVAEGENRAAGLPDVSDIDPYLWKGLLAHRARLDERRREIAASDEPAPLIRWKGANL